MSLKTQNPAGSAPDSDARAQVTQGVLLGASSYVIWGLVPLFWKQIQHVPASEIMLFRIGCTVLFCLGLVAWMGRLSALAAIWQDRRTLGLLAISAVLIGGNWWIFIWAVNDGRILETSLGYFINPLMTIFLGVTVLGERLNRLQTLAVAIAAAGVLYQTIAVGVAPWVSLTLAASFAVYGLVRKHTNVQSIDGLLVETTLILPVALAYGFWLASHGGMRFMHDGAVTQILLLLAGPLTAIPLMLFASAVRKVRLSTMGFLQYIAPTLTMLTAVFVYHEPLGHDRLITFGLIWAALILVSYDLIRRDYSAAA
jgi:chloramphenicol-sensitive protein RarD